MKSASRDAWDEVEIGPRRVLPALPDRDADLGEIRWDRWERALLLTHIDPSCESCAYPGPLACAMGKTLHHGKPRRTLLQRSRIAEGKRPVWGPAVTPEPWWVCTHWASRCQACDEMVVWCMSGERPRCQECAAVSPPELEGKTARCPACQRSARHVTPGGTTGVTDTWVEVAYNPPRTRAAAPRPQRGKAPPQEEVLF